MRDLRLIGVHDDGEHLVVTDDAGEEFRLRIDDPLRAAARRDRPRLGQLQIAIDNDVRPREVQAMIRAGATADEVAARTGWDLDKIARFEGPVLAEREHIATRAQSVRMRGTNQAGSPETLAQRAATRFNGRGVEPSSVLWDAYRDTEGQWTVSAIFAAGGRERTATWWFDQAGMSVVARNDEAKWLSEADTPSGPVPTAVHRPTAVFDVEVEEKTAERATRANTDDLINSMREHSGAKSRRRGGRRKSRATDAGTPTEDALPLEELPPPAGGTHPEDQAADAPEQPKVSAPAAAESKASSRSAGGTDTTGHQGTAPDKGSVSNEGSASDKGAAVAHDSASDDKGAADRSSSPQKSVTDTPAANKGATNKGAASSPSSASGAATTKDTALAAEPPQTTTPPKAAQSASPQSEPAQSTTSQNPTRGADEDTSAPAAEMKAEPEQEVAHDDASDAPDEADQDSSAKGRGRKGRAKVPSWDDVMFGTTRD